MLYSVQEFNMYHVYLSFIVQAHLLYANLIRLNNHILYKVRTVLQENKRATQPLTSIMSIFRRPHAL